MSSKLREALNQLLGLIDNGILVFSNELDSSEVSNAQYQIDKADEALDEPLRNCDERTMAKVYTAQEMFDKATELQESADEISRDAVEEGGCTYKPLCKADAREIETIANMLRQAALLLVEAKGETK